MKSKNKETDKKKPHTTIVIPKNYIYSLDIQLKIEHNGVQQMWVAVCPTLSLATQAFTPWDALINLGSILHVNTVLDGLPKRIKKEKQK